MDARDRRQQILEQLKKASKPISATALAQTFHVSRQLIVGDIALLRASGTEIEATARGYQLPGRQTAPQTFRRMIACRHESDQTQEELYAIVDQGCTVLDVIVEHPIYGQLIGTLQLSSRYDVDQFLIRSQQAEARPLSFLTEGIHLHTITCPSPEAADRVCKALKELGILLPDNI